MRIAGQAVRRGIFEADFAAFARTYSAAARRQVEASLALNAFGGVAVDAVRVGQLALGA